jgi:ribosomal protein S18 acetylase RimI-like enzyme
MINIAIHTVQNQKELDDMYYQRWLVLREPLGMARGTEKDKYDDSAFYLVAIYNDQVIGSARLRELSESVGSIAYVAVIPKFQKQGIGTKLIKKLIEQAQKKNLMQLKLMVRLNTLGFYKRLGFMEQGIAFNYLDIPHIFMYLDAPFL